ncbi:SprB repeat-containing protein, partial [uncultured Tenacibaculum sp.]|uniref:SprB repeat-containing protein n=1 Tax=uncultured Tenacibaculum sp. TaxID=174713 RepID=UPI00261C9AE1
LSTAHIVEAAPTFTLDIDNIQNVTCFGGTTGSSELIFSTSTPYTGNYTYEIFNVGGVTTGITGNGVGNVVEALAGLGAGNYYVSVTMTDSPFCPVQSANFEIQGPAAALGVSGVVNPPVSCNGGSDGTITATGTDGWGGYDYQLEFLAGGVVGTYTYSNNNVFTGLA